MGLRPCQTGALHGVYMRDSRLRRFVGGLGIGYLHTAMVVIVGLWLTPYLLSHLGSHDYGLWLLAAQFLIYLGLLDFGIIQLVPRDVAIAAGRPGDHSEEVAVFVGQTARLVLWQMPVVVAAGVVVMWLIPGEWAPLRWPLAIVVIAFVLTFPLRIFGAVLQGLQDLAFLGSVQLAAWLAGSIATVAGIFFGWGLYSLALGWVVTQVLSAGVAWWRLERSFPQVMPARLPAVPLSMMRERFGQGAWISVNQVAQVLLGGTDLVVIGRILGPEAVVPYAVTGKLLLMLANQPQLFMQTALPALSDLRTSAPRQRLFDVSRSMTQAMLLGSGAIVVVVLAINEPFVTWWVGESRFAGVGLTGLLLTGMLVRHLNVTAVYSLFCFGHERRLAITSVADGLAGLAGMLILVPIMGLYGAALAPLIATCVVSLPSNLRALAREEGVSPLAFLAPLGSWAGRFLAIAGAVAAFVSVWDVRGFWGFVPLAIGVGALYAAVMVPVLQTPPLGVLLSDRLQPWLSFVPGFSRRLDGQPTHEVSS